MDYDQLIRRMKRIYRNDQEGVLQLQSEIAKDCNRAGNAIMELLKYKEAIERMEEFGRLFLEYTGCPRGPIGRSGGVSLSEEVTQMDVLTDVDGGRWRPVNEDVLQDLLSRAEALESENAALRKIQPVRLDGTGVSAIALAAEVSDLRQRLAVAEADNKRLREAMKPNCLLCDSMHENGNCTEVGGFCTAVTAAHCPLIPRLITRAEKAEAQRDAAVKELNEVAAAVDDLDEFIDEQIHPLVQYDMYTALRENADAISMWQYESEWRGQKEE